MQSVRATGQVISNTDLDLSFGKSGTVKSVKTSVGDKVILGQILANLDQGEAIARLTQARGALLSAEARYAKVIDGSSNEEVALAETSLRNAKTDLENIKNSQALLVSNAHRNLLSSTPEAFSTSSSQTAPSITGSYGLENEGEIKISLYQTGDGYRFSATGLVNGSGYYSTSSPQPIGNSGLFIRFSSTSSSSGDWTIPIPNKQASDYLANNNAYQSALKTQASAVATAESLVSQEAELALKKASARPADVDFANADIISARGTLQSAQSAYEDTVIRAPAPGTVTKVDLKYGEQASVGKAAITIEDVENLYVEALINESNIAYLELGQKVNITFDAFGGERKFSGIIAHIDPSAQTNDGVVNYKIKVTINEVDETIRPGMNANITVIAGQKKNVLAVPNIAVTKKDGKSYVNVVTDESKKKYEARAVVTGFLGDNNLIEIKSGLAENDKVALLQSDGQ
jgi:HlyD family secretion protein